MSDDSGAARPERGEEDEEEEEEEEELTCGEARGWLRSDELEFRRHAASLPFRPTQKLRG